MYMTDNNEIDNEELFDAGDFVFTQRIGEDGNKEIVGGGYKVNSIFLQNNISPMTTYNKDDQTGGKVSSPFENLAVPAGLFYINMKVPNKDNKDKDTEHHYKGHTTISDDIMDKLFGLVEADKKNKRKTRKHKVRPDKTNTRKRK